MARLLRFAGLCGLLLGLGLGGAALVRAKRARLAAAPAPTARPTPVRLGQAARGDLVRSRRFLARVEPWQEARLAARIAGRVERVGPREGEEFEAGLALVELDGVEARAARDGAASRVSEARALLAAREAEQAALEKSAAYWAREAERARALARDGSLSPSQAEAAAERGDEVAGRLASALEAQRAAALRVEALEAEESVLEARLADTVLRAPWPGVVARRIVEPGDMALSGQPLLVLHDLSRLRIRIGVPQEEAHLVRAGQELRVARPGEPLVLAVDRIFPSLGPDRSLELEATAPGGSGLLPGAYVDADLAWESLEGVVLVPEDALLPAPGGAQGLFLVEQGRTVPRLVELLGRAGGMAAVAGLEEGVPVVRSTYLGWTRLSAGERVEGVQ